MATSDVSIGDYIEYCGRDDCLTGGKTYEVLGTDFGGKTNFYKVKSDRGHNWWILEKEIFEKQKPTKSTKSTKPIKLVKVKERKMFEQKVSEVELKEELRKEIAKETELADLKKGYEEELDVKDRTHSKHNENRRLEYMLEIKTIKAEHLLKTELLISQHFMNTERLNHEISTKESKDVIYLKKQLVIAQIEAAGISKENELLKEAVKVSGDIIDIKDMFNSLMSKLPEIKISGLSVNSQVECKKDS